MPMLRDASGTAPSPPRTITASLWRLFIAVGCAIMLLALALYWSWERVATDRQAISRSEIVERNLRALGEDLLEAQTAHQGYLLTLDPRYLEPYDHANVDAPRRLEVLDRFMVDPPARRDLDRIRPLVSALLDELAAVVTLSASGQHELALQNVRAGSDKRLMNDFLRVERETLSRERDLLDRRRLRIDESMLRSALILSTGGAAILIFLLLYTRRTAGRLEAQQALLDSRQEKDLAQSYELVRVTLESIADAVITTDQDGQVVWLNPMAESMTGWTKDEARARPLADVFKVSNAEEPQTQTTLLSRAGTEYGIEHTASPIRNAQGQTLGAVLVFHDVSEQRRLTREMSHRATHDVLTGLVNRAEFEHRLARLLQGAGGEVSGHVLMYIDLDEFKVVNDACGHAAGDQLLRQVSVLLQGCMRGRDTVARLGGDEFGVILEMCDIEHGRDIAQKICDQMELYRFAHDGRRYRIGTSIGVVPVDARWSNSAAVLQAADSCCYAAKDAGRNRVHVWVESDRTLLARQGEMQWVNRLEAALDENRFILFAQRIEPIGGPGSKLHCEVLLRLRDDDGSMVLPGSFLPAAERFHLIGRIDKWILHKVFALLEANPIALDRIDTIAVNLSGQSIGDRAFHRELLRMLQEARFDLHKLCLEVTETAAITNLGDARILIDEVRSLGVRISLDDFGAGASSFGYLRMLTVDYLKIDGQFITGLLDDPLNHAAVRCFCEVARVVAVQTIAESVERRDVRDALQRIGVDLVQGHLIHRPEALAALLVAQPPCIATPHSLPIAKSRVRRKALTH